jgi:hypothetical protein
LCMEAAGFRLDEAEVSRAQAMSVHGARAEKECEREARSAWGHCAFASAGGSGHSTTTS